MVLWINENGLLNSILQLHVYNLLNVGDDQKRLVLAKHDLVIMRHGQSKGSQIPEKELKWRIDKFCWKRGREIGNEDDDNDDNLNDNNVCFCNKNKNIAMIIKIIVKTILIIVPAFVLILSHLASTFSRITWKLLPTHKFLNYHCLVIIQKLLIISVIIILEPGLFRSWPFRAGTFPWLAFGMEWFPIGSPVTS